MALISVLTYKKIELDYSQYSKPFSVRCPICKHYASRTRKYRTLKSLLHHLATDHKTDGMHPFSVEDAREIVKAIAIALQWGMFVE